VALPEEIAVLTVERLRGTVTADDAHGNQTIDWSDPDVLEISDCWIGPAGRGLELRDARQTVILDEYWWGPEDADVLETDRIKNLRTGVTYEVSTAVVSVADPDEELGHKTCGVQVITG
jgi:hypothetical protein